VRLTRKRGRRSAWRGRRRRWRRGRRAAAAAGGYRHNHG